MKLHAMKPHAMKLHAMKRRRMHSQTSGFHLTRTLVGTLRKERRRAAPCDSSLDPWSPSLDGHHSRASGPRPLSPESSLDEDSLPSPIARDGHDPCTRPHEQRASLGIDGISAVEGSHPQARSRSYDTARAPREMRPPAAAKTARFHHSYDSRPGALIPSVMPRCSNPHSTASLEPSLSPLPGAVFLGALVPVPLVPVPLAPACVSFCTVPLLRRTRATCAVIAIEGV